MGMGKAAKVPDGTILDMAQLTPEQLAEAAEASLHYERERKKEARGKAGAAGAGAAGRAVGTPGTERGHASADNPEDAEREAEAAIAAALAEAARMDVRMVTYASAGLAVKAYVVMPGRMEGTAGKDAHVPERRDGHEHAADMVERRNGQHPANFPERRDGQHAPDVSERPEGTGRDGDVPGEPAGRWPGLVYCRGGIKRVGMVNLPRMVALARRGYAVMAPLYRGNLGGEGREDFAGEDRFDAVNAVRALAALPDILPRPIPLLGFSRGSVMALAAATEGEEAVGPVAVLGGVSDMFLTYEERVDLRRMLRRVVGHPRKDPEAYRFRSPLCWAERIGRPVLILHGTDDPLVGVEHARRLAKTLTALGKPCELRLFDGLGHRFPPREEEAMLDAVTDWFARYGAPPAGHPERVR